MRGALLALAVGLVPIVTFGAAGFTLVSGGSSSNVLACPQHQPASVHVQYDGGWVTPLGCGEKFWCTLPSGCVVSVRATLAAQAGLVAAKAGVDLLDMANSTFAEDEALCGPAMNLCEAVVVGASPTGHAVGVFCQSDEGQAALQSRLDCWYDVTPAVQKQV